MRQPLAFGPRVLIIFLLFSVLTACGGGGGSKNDGNSNINAGQNTSGWTAGVFPASGAFKARCENPRTGIDPETGSPWPDEQGTALDEKNWLRSWSNELYLWYDEITDRNPAPYSVSGYFDLLKTNAILPSGRPKDPFHFTYDTDEWNQMSQSGVSFGYGLTWAVLEREAPREIRVADTDPDTSATLAPASLERGDLLLEINGVDVINTTNAAEIDLINSALYPEGDGETYSFTFRDNDTGLPRTFSMTSGSFVSTLVQHVKTIPTPTGDVGYLLFKSHFATAQQQLIDGFEQLLAAGVTDLVIDMRYNGGGYLAIASQLAYMIAGNAATQDEIFFQTRFNDKHPSTNPFTGAPLLPTPFYSVSLNYTNSSTFISEPLPTLNLNRVYVLTGSNTCSASEALINGLRGVGVEVIQIGTTTCGKPYGFYPTDNCGTTYFSIHFSGANAQGFGDYSGGFSPENTQGVVGTPVPGCSVADDYLHEFGDPAEARLAAALEYRQTGTCPVSSGVAIGGWQKTAGAVAEAYIQTEPGRQALIIGNVK